MLKKLLYLLSGAIISFCIFAIIDGMDISTAFAALGIVAGFGLVGYTIYVTTKRWPNAALRVSFAVTLPSIVIMFGAGAVTLFVVAIKHASLTYGAATSGAFLDAGQNLIATAFTLLCFTIVTWLGMDLVRMTAR